jgi:tetratricopeptide (TPR) repeat protein
MYLPLAGPVVLFIAGTYRFISRALKPLSSTGLRKAAMAAAAALAIVLIAFPLGALTFFKNRACGKDAAMWASVLSENSDRPSRLFMEIGSRMLSTGRPGKAILWFEKALRFDPKDPGAYNDMGYALAILGKNREAIYWYKKALFLSPGLCRTHLNLAEALFSIGERKEAEEHLKKAGTCGN